MSPLMQALEDLEMVKLLIASGADVNKKNFRGATALMGAAADGQILISEFVNTRPFAVSAPWRPHPSAPAPAYGIRV